MAVAGIGPNGNVITAKPVRPLHLAACPRCLGSGRVGGCADDTCIEASRVRCVICRREFCGDHAVRRFDRVVCLACVQRGVTAEQIHRAGR